MGVITGTVDTSTKKTPAPVAIDSLAAQIRSINHGLSAPVRTALDQITGGLDSIRQSIAGGASGNISLTSPLLGATIQEITLSSSTTNIVPSLAAVVGATWILVLTIDNTSGRQITLDSTIKGMTVDDIDNTANKINIYTFVGRSDKKWWNTTMRLGLSA